MTRRMLAVVGTAMLAAVLAAVLTACTEDREPGLPNTAGGTTLPATSEPTVPVPATTPAPASTTAPEPTAPASTTGPGPTAPVTGSPQAPVRPASTRCTAAVLRGTVQGGNPAAGNRYARLVVTNTGGRTCTLYGYGGFQLVDANGRALPTSTRRDEPPGPSLVRLAPGATAAKNLHWVVVPTGNEPVEGPCQPEPRSARVIPPDETEPFTVEWRFGPVCAAGRFHDSAYYLP